MAKIFGLKNIYPHVFKYLTSNLPTWRKKYPTTISCKVGNKVELTFHTLSVCKLLPQTTAALLVPSLLSKWL